MGNMITDFVFYFMIFLLPNVVLTIKRSSKSVLNPTFNGYEISESYIRRVNDYSLPQCSSLCAETPSCISMNYNKISKTCVLFDKDFIRSSVTSGQMVDGWLYYYVIPDKEMKPVTCNAPYTPDICSRYCLYYIHDEAWGYAQLESICRANYDGEMVIIDRQLKNYCVQKLLEIKDPDKYDNIYIQGKRNETTNLWTYNDGTPITYFNWNNGQPDKAVNEIYLAFMHTNGYLWNDVFDDKIFIHATVCQQT